LALKKHPLQLARVYRKNHHFSQGILSIVPIDKMALHNRMTNT